MNPRIKQLAKRLLRVFGIDPIHVSIWDIYTNDALALAHGVDCNPKDLRERQQNPDRVNPVVANRVCHWFLPHFDNPFYGGIMTILRLANHLQQTTGMKNRFFIYGSCDPAEIRNLIGKAWPKLGDSDVFALDSNEAVAAIPPSDYSIATLWTTAYLVLGIKNTGLKFYMIQDFEPLFYPAGSTYAQAEFTYSFGFYGIANTISLKEMYERDYGRKAVTLEPCIDTNIFHPGPQQTASQIRRLFYYARPGTPRNGFELAAQALKILKGRLGDNVDIICAGANWKPADYGLESVVRNIGLLPYEKTADLYRSCHAGLSMMMTKHPSYLPFEMMACGCLVVANRNAANTWLLKDGENCLIAPPTAWSIADALERALTDDEALQKIRSEAITRIQMHHSDWNQSLGRVADFILGLAPLNRSAS